MGMRLGLKLFSTNTALAQNALGLVVPQEALPETSPEISSEAACFDFIELYTVPGTLEQVPIWQGLHAKGCPFVIHAPHFGHGVNLSNAALAQSNARFMAEARAWADALGAKYIIVHGGFMPSAAERAAGMAELCRQVGTWQNMGQGMGNEGRVLLENTPAVGTANQATTAYSPEHMATALGSGVFAGMVLDVGHAVYAANSLGQSPESVLRAMVALKPVHIHVSDGDLDSEKDVHKNIGQGNFPLAQWLRLLPDNVGITIETPRASGHLNEAVHDAVALRKTQWL